MQKKGGLASIFRHNEIRDELVNLAGKAFTPSGAVRDEPLIKPGRVKESEKDTPTKDTSQEKTEQTATGEDERGDLLIRGLWTRGTDCILDVCVTDTDTKSFSKRDPTKELESQEKEKNQKYLEACLERRRHSTMDGMHGREAKPFAQYLAAKLASKRKKSYSQVCGYVNARLSIAIARAMHLCMRGSRVRVYKIGIRYPQWENGASLSLFEC